MKWATEKVVFHEKVGKEAKSTVISKEPLEKYRE
jgi:hypothetical protein